VWLVALAGATAAVLFWFAGVSPAHPYAYDEADYMYAATRGIWNNYWDRPSISFAEFVSKGLELARNPRLRSNFSQYIRSTGDITFYRHFHGPLYSQWVGVWHALGVQTEAGYRRTGLVLHLLTTLVIYFGFRAVFPSLPAAGAFVAAAAFLTNRTALVTSLAITQHTLFIFLTVATLFLASRFCRDLEPRYWYGAMACLALAFATVETSVLVLAALGLTLAVLGVRLRAQWPPRELVRLLLKGVAVFAAVLVAAWPASLLKLSFLKGYLYLAYMTLRRKTFVPTGPEELWAAKLRTAPLEFVLPALAVAATLIFWRKLPHRRELAPFLAYTGIFLVTTLVITLSYTHYHGSLMAALAVLTGVWFGEMWRRTGTLVRVTALGLVLAVLGGMAHGYYLEARANQMRAPVSTQVLEYLQSRPEHLQKVWLIPYTLVPTLHFYHPETHFVGYDTDRAPEDLAAAAMRTGSSVQILCEVSGCAELEAALKEYGQVGRIRIARGWDGEIHLLRVERR
jgi:hypothetical protein